TTFTHAFTRLSISPSNPPSSGTCCVNKQIPLPALTPSNEILHSVTCSPLSNSITFVSQHSLSFQFAHNIHSPTSATHSLSAKKAIPSAYKKQLTHSDPRNRTFIHTFSTFSHIYPETH